MEIDPMTTPIRWGILGTGNIAGQFAQGLTSLDDAELVAVGSRSQESADSFGDRFGVPRRHGSYEALASDPLVDAVYIGTPHSLHKENTIMCLKAGKAVLCEKPFAINAAETREMIAVARERKLFLMEAVWSRFLPLLVKLRELLAEGAIGEVRMLYADFGFRASVNPESRLFNPALGGGALLDVGIYPVSLAHMILGKPNRIAALAEIGETGVDEQGAMILGFPKGELALLSTAIRTSTPHEATILGTKGSIRLEREWWHGTKLTLQRGDGAPEQLDLPFEGNGYNYEAAEVGRCLREGRLESDVIPLDETLEVMETLDAIRAQWGLKYPME
jgi:predicted dehydrogenase